MNSLAVDQDICNLKKECEEKDATIKELKDLLHSSDVTGSKVFTCLLSLASKADILFLLSLSIFLFFRGLQSLKI